MAGLRHISKQEGPLIKRPLKELLLEKPYSASLEKLLIKYHYTGIVRTAAKAAGYDYEPRPSLSRLEFLNR